MSRDFRVSFALRRVLRLLLENGEVAVAIHYGAPWMRAASSAEAC